MANIDFKITVEFHCSNMIDEDYFAKEFNSDAELAYKFISDDFGDSVFNFSDSEKIIKIEVVKPQ